LTNILSRIFFRSVAKSIVEIKLETVLRGHLVHPCGLQKKSEIAHGRGINLVRDLAARAVGFELFNTVVFVRSGWFLQRLKDV
jgi:hypothetical protein